MSTKGVCCFSVKVIYVVYIIDVNDVRGVAM